MANEAIYIAQADGYIIDNPNIDFERCDGRVFSYDEVSAANTNSTMNNVTINGGQGNYPLAIIDTDRSMELTFSSANFTMDMFVMSQNAKEEYGDFGTRETARYEVDDELKITIPYEVKEGSVYIHGLTEADAAGDGKYKVEITQQAEGTSPSTVITFGEGDHVDGDIVRVSYIRRVNGAVRMVSKTNSTSAKGALTAHWPVYSSGSDCTESSIKGWLHLFLYRCRATAMPGFDNSLTLRLPA